MRSYSALRSRTAASLAGWRGTLMNPCELPLPTLAHVARLLTAALIALSFPACVIQAPNSRRQPHIEYPVVAASESETFAGTVDNNLMTGTAYVDLQSSSTDARCRGEGHLVQRPVSTCAGGQGACSLKCDDGTVIDCRYKLASCTSGAGLGLSQDRKWFAFSFGPAMSGLEGQLMTAKLKKFVVSLPNALPPKESRREKGFSTGTGFFVSRDGYVVSAFHVIEDAQEVAVMLRSGDTLRATVKGIDDANDIALLKVAHAAKPLPMVSSKGVAVGDPVFTLGYPLIEIEGQEQKATFGRVNALSGVQDDVRFVQMDAAVQPGNSGGPLLDYHGRVVGVVTRSLSPAALLKETGTIPQNANYAVKSDYILPLMTRYEVDAAAERDGIAHTEAEMIKRVRDSVVLVIAH